MSAAANSMLLALIGLSGGLIVGSGFVAFLTVLALIPRLVQITKCASHLIYFQWAVVFGALGSTLFTLFCPPLYLASAWLIVPGLFMGIFVGLLAAALTEVLNVIPILAKRMYVYEYLALFILALALGKMAGSLFYWIYFVR